MSITLDSTTFETHWPLTNVRLHEVYRAEPRFVRRISSDQGPFVMKVADPSKGQEAIEHDVAIFDFLAQQNFPAPKLLSTKDDKPYLERDGRYCYILTYIEGASEPPAVPQTWGALGDLTARLHVLEGYETPTLFTAESEIPQMVARARQYNIGPEYDALVQSLPDFSQLPKCFIHTDISLLNVIQLHDGSLALVDWDDAGIGIRLLDIGFPLICGFVQDGAFQAENAKAFYDAYAAKIQLTDEEKAHIFDAGMLYILSYSIFDSSGIHHGNWKKAQWAVEHREEIEKAFASK